MLRMDQVHVIRDQVLRAGRSIRSVAKEFGISRKTVAKYLRQPEPLRLETSPRRQPVREVIGDRFEELWRDWQDRSTGKHRVTGSGLWRQLVSRVTYSKRGRSSFGLLGGSDWPDTTPAPRCCRWAVGKLIRRETLPGEIFSEFFSDFGPPYACQWHPRWRRNGTPGPWPFQRFSIS